MISRRYLYVVLLAALFGLMSIVALIFTVFHSPTETTQSAGSNQSSLSSQSTVEAESLPKNSNTAQSSSSSSNAPTQTPTSSQPSTQPQVQTPVDDGWQLVTPSPTVDESNSAG